MVKNRRLKQLSALYLLTVASFLLGSSANALLVEADLYAPGDALLTRDTRTGLEWLDLTQTRGLSVNAANASALAKEQGFRVANVYEVDALYETALLTTPRFGDEFIANGALYSIADVFDPGNTFPVSGQCFGLTRCFDEEFFDFGPTRPVSIAAVATDMTRLLGVNSTNPFSRWAYSNGLFIAIDGFSLGTVSAGWSVLRFDTASRVEFLPLLPDMTFDTAPRIPPNGELTFSDPSVFMVRGGAIPSPGPLALWLVALPAFFLSINQRAKTPKR